MPRRRFDPVDISAQMNREMSPNPAGSPSSFGIDYCWISPGINTFESPGIGKIPFLIVDQAQNNGRAAAITQGGMVKQQTSMTYPKRFDFIVPENISSRVVRAHMLGIAAYWAIFTAEKEGMHGGDFIFSYSDGTQVVQPLINGIHYSDWAMQGGREARRNGDGTQVVTAVHGWSSNQDFDTRADILSIDLIAHAHRQLRRIALVDSGSPAAIPLLAITLEREVTVTTEVDEAGTAALRDLAPAVRLGDRKRLDALIESLITDISRLSEENFPRAQSSALMLIHLLIHAATETGAIMEGVELLPLRASKTLTASSDGSSLVGSLELLIQELLSKLYPKKNHHTERLIAQAAEYIRRHYAEDLRDEQVASLLNLSTSHFRHLFKQSTGMSFGRYFTLVRMENARRLLEETNLTVSEIARKIGYEDVSYCSRVFSQHFWVSPTEYRKKSS